MAEARRLALQTFRFISFSKRIRYACPVQLPNGSHGGGCNVAVAPERICTFTDPVLSRRPLLLGYGSFKNGATVRARNGLARLPCECITVNASAAKLVAPQGIAPCHTGSRPVALLLR